MTNTNVLQTCPNCKQQGLQKFCSNCGQAYKVKRITLHGLLHDVFHFFTHLDKGFGYTLKQLTVAPGHMQRDYINGNRSRHQKPFSMFFICATVAGLSRYWIHTALLKYYNSGDINEANFFHEYMVLLQIALLPLVALITYLFFTKSGYNYAEIGVLTLYTVSFFFLIVSVIALLKFIWPELDTAYIELPVLTVYNLLTNINFFNKTPAWLVGLKSLLLTSIIFLSAHFLEKWVIDIISSH
jgi:hypothetical protein